MVVAVVEVTRDGCVAVVMAVAEVAALDVEGVG